MRALAVIPARMAATRLPGKPLAQIGDVPLVQHVYRGAVASGVFDEVIVATDSDDVLEVVAGFGGRAERTSDAHESGTDRVAEVIARHPEYEVVANVQGDLLDADEQLLRGLLKPFATEPLPEMSTVAVPVSSPDMLNAPGTVKIVRNSAGNAMYFSRSLIPAGATEALHHVGLYAFRRDVIERFTALPRSPLEQAESLEQLRALEAGIAIHVEVVPVEGVREINTPEDLAAAQGGASV